MQQTSFLYTVFAMTSDAFAIPQRSERKPIKKAIVLMIDEDALDARHAGTAVDMSDHRDRVEAEAALIPGQTLNLIEQDDPTCSLRCMVVSTGEVSSDGHDQLGLEFLDPLPDDMKN